VTTTATVILPWFLC